MMKSVNIEDKGLLFLTFTLLAQITIDLRLFLIEYPRTTFEKVVELHVAPVWCIIFRSYVPGNSHDE